MKNEHPIVPKIMICFLLSVFFILNCTNCFAGEYVTGPTSPAVKNRGDPPLTEFPAYGQNPTWTECSKNWPHVCPKCKENPNCGSEYDIPVTSLTHYTNFTQSCGSAFADVSVSGNCGKHLVFSFGDDQDTTFSVDIPCPVVHYGTRDTRWSKCFRGFWLNGKTRMPTAARMMVPLLSER